MQQLTHGTVWRAHTWKTAISSTRANPGRGPWERKDRPPWKTSSFDKIPQSESAVSEKHAKNKRREKRENQSRRTDPRQLFPHDHTKAVDVTATNANAHPLLTRQMMNLHQPNAKTIGHNVLPYEWTDLQDKNSRLMETPDRHWERVTTGGMLDQS